MFLHDLHKLIGLDFAPHTPPPNHAVPTASSAARTGPSVKSLGHGLDDPKIVFDSRYVQESPFFSQVSGPGLGPTLPTNQLVPGVLSRRQDGQNVKPITHLMPTLRMSAAVPLPLTSTTLPPLSHGNIFSTVHSLYKFYTHISFSR